MSRSSKPKQRRWTQAAIECLKRHCVCEGCIYSEFFENAEYVDLRVEGQLIKHTCQMKSAVLESVRLLGKPKGFIEPTIINEKE